MLVQLYVQCSFKCCFLVFMFVSWSGWYMGIESYQYLSATTDVAFGTGVQRKIPNDLIMSPTLTNCLVKCPHVQLVHVISNN